MKILLANSIYPPHPASGGGGDRIAGWAVERLREAGHEVEVLTARLPRGVRAPRGVHDLLRPLGPWDAPRDASLPARIRGAAHARSDIRDVRALLASRRPDALLAGAFLNTSPTYLFAARDLGIPTTLWIFTEREIRLLDEAGARLLRFVLGATGIIRPSLRAGVFRGIAASNRALLDALHRAGWRAEREAVVRNGVPIPPQPARPPEGPPWKILWVSRLIPDKGYDDALEALAILRHDGVPFEATFAGRGGEAEERDFRARVELLGMGSAVRHLGFVDDRTHRALFDTHHLYWMTSRLPEGTSLSLLEAMARGRAAVVAASGGNAEVLENGREGILVPPGDPARLAAASREILSDPARRMRMEEAARAHAVRNYSDRRMAEELLSLMLPA